MTSLIPPNMREQPRHTIPRRVEVNRSNQHEAASLALVANYVETRVAGWAVTLAGSKKLCSAVVPWPRVERQAKNLELKTKKPT